MLTVRPRKKKILIHHQEQLAGVMTPHGDGGWEICSVSLDTKRL